MRQDDGLADRMRRALATQEGITERRMMGGTIFLRDGHMLCGARVETDGPRRFMFRIGKAQEAEALQDPTAHPLMQGARRMGGYIVVEDEACPGAALQIWLERALRFVETLPPKT